MKYGRIEIVSKTPGPVVDLDTIKGFCYVSLDMDDALLTSMEVAAVAKCEAYLRRSLLGQVSTLWFDASVYGTISTPFGKLNSIESVKTYSETDEEVTISPNDYVVDTASDQYGRIRFKENVNACGLRELNPIGITINTGYADVDSVPQLIKQAILTLISSWYENREMYAEQKLPTNARIQLNPYRIQRI